MANKTIISIRYKNIIDLKNLAINLRVLYHNELLLFKLHLNVCFDFIQVGILVHAPYYKFNVYLGRLVRMKKLATIILLILFLPGLSIAAVSGSCVNCHTMHNSQNGSDMIYDDSYNPGTGPYSSLLRTNGCVGCHSSSTSSTTYDIGDGCDVPVVLYTGGEPSSYLAGGNFYWVEALGVEYGHNAVSNTDSILTMAPGLSNKTAAIGCNGSCHYKLAQWEWKWWGCPSQHRENIGVGCVGCHTPAHHSSGSTTPIADEEDGWFRFLARKHAPVPGPNTTARNVKGWEDPDWQQTASPTDHNEYFDNGDVPGGPSNSGISRFCVACHTDYHSIRFGPGGSGSGWYGSWLRHPAGVYLPNTGETSKYNTDGSGENDSPGAYNPDVPVARQFIASVTGPSSTVTTGPGGDMVACISCHRAHGSPYPDMLRWNYSGQLAGGGGDDETGCFVCHTAKDGT